MISKTTLSVSLFRLAHKVSALPNVLRLRYPKFYLIFDFNLGAKTTPALTFNVATSTTAFGTSTVTTCKIGTTKTNKF